MTPARLCRVCVTLPDGSAFKAHYYSDDTVKVFRYDLTGWSKIGSGPFVNGEILGMPGGDVVDPRAYAALEGALEAWLDVA